MPSYGFEKSILLPEVKDEFHSVSSSDDFELVTEFDDVQLKKKDVCPPYPLGLELHPLQEENAVLISIHPPRQPEHDIKHVPCDIVLVIDVSGSMADAAPLPETQDKDEKESSGLTILDLTKHAARTILETLNENDRLGIVTFSRDATIVQPLTQMTPEDKKATALRIEALTDEGVTNLWAGIRQGLALFDQDPRYEGVAGMYVLTDGRPNMMCPSQGYVAKLRPMLQEGEKISPAIHTFGFGYSIMSNLLQSIAEVGNGNYAFIPDAGMIGTVFVHAVANLYSTYASSATVELQMSSKKGTLRSTSGIPAKQEDGVLTLKLGNIQYGQSRDTIVHYTGATSKTNIQATVIYKLNNGTYQTTSRKVDLSTRTTLSKSYIQYHLYRTQLCSLLASLFPFKANGEHKAEPPIAAGEKDRFIALASSIRSTLKQLPSDPNLLSLLEDLVGTDSQSSPASEGQILQALCDTAPYFYWKRWGQHYLPSLLHAHMRQTCNSFKDAGPLRYGADSPLFLRCRQELDTAFDALPAPTPSYVDWRDNSPWLGNGVCNGNGMTNATRPRRNIRMSQFNSSSNPCFLGSCTVRTGREPSDQVQVQDLRTGMQVWCPSLHTTRAVAAVVKTKTSRPGQTVCKIGQGLWITKWHPILHNTPPRNAQPQWIFPADVAQEERELKLDESVYSIILEPSSQTSAHAIEVEGITCVTLGHGLTAPTTSESFSPTQHVNDARVHPFFGNYAAIIANIANLPVDNDKNHSLSAGVTRNPLTGLACEFLPPASEQVSEPSSSQSNTVVSDDNVGCERSQDFPSPFVMHVEDWDSLPVTSSDSSTSTSAAAASAA